VQWSEWNAIDRAERRLGASKGRERVKIHDRAHLLRASNSPDEAPA
jgi:hypothetical protein